MKAFILIALVFFTSSSIQSQKAVFNNENAASNILSFDKSGIDDNDYALVAGGSKGIGYAIAEALAKRKFNLILIARHQDALSMAKEKLESKYKIHVEILKLDLAYETTADSISKWCSSKNIRLKMLCNVAGLGGTDDYLTLPADSLRYMINLNLESPAVLTFKLLPLLEASLRSIR